MLKSAWPASAGAGHCIAVGRARGVGHRATATLSQCERVGGQVTALLWGERMGGPPRRCSTAAMQARGQVGHRTASTLPLVK